MQAKCLPRKFAPKRTPMLFIPTSSVGPVIITDPSVLVCRYFSDLIIAFLQDHLAAAALLPAPEDEAIPETLPEPMLPGTTPVHAVHPASSH